MHRKQRRSVCPVGITDPLAHSMPTLALLFYRGDTARIKLSRDSPEGIIPTRMKGVAFKDPCYCEEPSFDNPVFLNGKGGIRGTCGHKPTRGW